jgi:hypothetical protein
MIITRQTTEYVFYWAGSQPDRTRILGSVDFAEVAFSSPQQAVLFLRRFSELFEFRKLLELRFPGQVYRWRIDDIFNKLGELMAKKQLLVVKRWVPAEGPSRAELTPLPMPRRQAPERAVQPEPATFLSNHDGDAQAEALENASSSGEAFCEECERLAAAQRQPSPPAPPEESFQPDHDGDAQAAVLINAAAEGVPFCEECEKARRAAA